MTDAYKFGAIGTDTLTGKTVKFGMVNIFNSTGAVCFQVGGADYAVAADKTFYLGGFLLEGLTVNKTIELRYANNAALTTNPVTIFTISASVGSTLGPGCMKKLLPMYATVPSSKYFGIYTASTGVYTGVYMIGYEA